jgi:hypothetical protein
VPMVDFIHSRDFRLYEFFVIPKLFILYIIKYFLYLYVLILFILNIYYFNFNKQNLFIKKIGKKKVNNKFL